MKYGILLTTFGSSSSQCQASFSNFESQVREHFPVIPIRWAFTSKKLKRQPNSTKIGHIDYLDNMLSKMAVEQFTHIAVQPLQVISGMEYSELVSKVELLGKYLGFACILVGEPLITDCICSTEKIKKAIFSVIPYERKQNEPVIFMGHGNKYLTEDKYKPLSIAVMNEDPLVFIGTMNGSYRLEHILLALGNILQPIWLIPFFTIIGQHVLKDMVGKLPNSWQSQLEAAGFSCIPILKGMLDSKPFSDIWIEHLKITMAILRNC